MNYGKVFLGLLAGLAAGATLGILFAPDKGSTTRKKISKRSNDYTNELKGKVENFIGDITKKFDSMKKSITHIVDNGGNKIAEIENDVFTVSKKNNV